MDKLLTRPVAVDNSKLRSSPSVVLYVSAKMGKLLKRERERERERESGFSKAEIRSCCSYVS
jgi:hypothetical protein